jgi:ParB family chromosome partitioning protein
METSETSIAIDLIFPNPNQPRKLFDQDKLEELAGSIKAYGVLEPIVVTRRPRLDADAHLRFGYMIVGGERRWRASQIAGLTEMPVRVIDADDALVEELALLENIQREDLNVIEQALAFQSLLDRGWTKEKLAEKMGFKQSWRIDERLALLNLTGEIRTLVISGEVRASEAYHVSRVPQAQQHIVLKAIKDGKVNTWAKVTRFVDGLLASQETLFELQTANEAEIATIRDFERSLLGISHYLEAVTSEHRLDHLRKVSFHSSITCDQIDVVIAALQKVRLKLLEGQGVKDAKEAV